MSVERERSERVDQEFRAIEIPDIVVEIEWPPGPPDQTNGQCGRCGERLYGLKSYTPIREEGTDRYDLYPYYTMSSKSYCLECGPGVIAIARLRGPDEGDYYFKPFSIDLIDL